MPWSPKPTAKTESATDIWVAFRGHLFAHARVPRICTERSRVRSEPVQSDLRWARARRAQHGARVRRRDGLQAQPSNTAPQCMVVPPPCLPQYLAAGVGRTLPAGWAPWCHARSRPRRSAGYVSCGCHDGRSRVTLGIRPRIRHHATSIVPVPLLRCYRPPDGATPTALMIGLRRGPAKLAMLFSLYEHAPFSPFACVRTFAGPTRRIVFGPLAPTARVERAPQSLPPSLPPYL